MINYIQPKNFKIVGIEILPLYRTTKGIYPSPYGTFKYMQDIMMIPKYENGKRIKTPLELLMKF